MLFVLVGESFTGKSVSAGTFPKPMLYLDYDGGFESIKNAKGKDGNLIVPDWEKIDVIEMKKQTVQELNFVTDMGKGGSGIPPKYVAESPELVKKYNEIMVSLEKNEKGYKSVVIDSLSSVFRNWKETLLKINSISSIRIADYGTLEGVLFGQFLPTLKALIIPYIILIDHVELEKDEITGQLLEYAVGPSRNMGRNLPKAVDEFYRQRVEGGDYVWRTKKTGFFQAGSRLNLPDLIKPATFQELNKYLKKEKEEKK